MGERPLLLYSAFWLVCSVNRTALEMQAGRQQKRRKEKAVKIEAAIENANR